MRNGYVLFENLEGDAGNERHMREIPPAKIIQLWCWLAQGAFTALESEPWEPGYG